MNTFMWIVVGVLASIALMVFLRIAADLIADSYFSRKEQHYSKMLKVFSECLNMLVEKLGEKNV